MEVKNFSDLTEVEKEGLKQSLKSNSKEVKVYSSEIQRLQNSANSDQLEISRLKSAVSTQHDEIVEPNNEAASTRRGIEDRIGSEMKLQERQCKTF